MIQRLRKQNAVHALTAFALICCAISTSLFANQANAERVVVQERGSGRVPRAGHMDLLAAISVSVSDPETPGEIEFESDIRLDVGQWLEPFDDNVDPEVKKKLMAKNRGYPDNMEVPLSGVQLAVISAKDFDGNRGEYKSHFCCIDLKMDADERKKKDPLTQVDMADLTPCEIEKSLRPVTPMNGKDGNHIFRTVTVPADQELGSGVTIPVKESGLYYLVAANCGMKRYSPEARIFGGVQSKHSHGFLSPDLAPVMNFHLMWTGVYAVGLLLWMTTCARWRSQMCKVLVGSPCFVLVGNLFCVADSVNMLRISH